MLSLAVSERFLTPARAVDVALLFPSPQLDLDYRRSQTLLTAVKLKGVGGGRRRRGNQVSYQML